MEIIKKEVKEVTEDSITFTFLGTETFKLKDLIVEKEKLIGQIDRQREELERVISEKEKRIKEIKEIDLLIKNFQSKVKRRERRRRRERGKI